MGRIRTHLTWASRRLALTLCLAGCEKIAHRHESGGEVTRNWTPPVVNLIDGVPSNLVVGQIQQRLTQKPPAPLSADNWKHVKKLYTALPGAPLWLDKDGLVQGRVNALLTALAGADSDAIQLDHLPLDSLHAALAPVEGSATPTPEQLMQADILLSSAYVAYAEAMLSGQVSPQDVSQNWHMNVVEPRMDSALVASLKTDSLAEGLTHMRPQDAGYGVLRHELVHYRDIVAHGGWPKIQAVGPISSKSIESSNRVALLRQRLYVEGYLQSDSGVTAPELSKAVSSFQTHHGIVADGVVGSETLDAINVPADYRLGQIAANLERYRWLPREFGSRYILVNVPEFRLDAYDSGQKALSMKVIVGAEYQDRATPVFADSMEFVIFRPYWDVPDGIAQKEIWPKADADPGYLDANNYEVYHDKAGQHVRQRPGGKNALGLVKFMFPNDFNVYLHDTPTADLFNKDVRAFSHGCIRLEHPDQLAQFALGWDADKVQAMMHGKDDNTVYLKHKIPVYILYLTAYASDDSLYFGNDLYARDDALVNAVTNGAQPSPGAIQAETTLVTATRKGDTK